MGQGPYRGAQYGIYDSCKAGSSGTTQGALLGAYLSDRRGLGSAAANLGLLQNHPPGVLRGLQPNGLHSCKEAEQPAAPGMHACR